MRKELVAGCLAAAVSAVVCGSPALSLVQAAPAARQELDPQPAPAPDKAGDQQAVPVKQVVLYTSGVGYFEHFGNIKGDGVTELHFKTGQINDILKSLVLEDLDHGKVMSVTYGSQEPLSHTLKSFEVDLSAAPPLSDLLGQLRGASVTATLAPGQVTGEILTVEKKQKPSDKSVIDVWVVDLLLPGGAIRPVELDQVSQIRLDDPKLQQELVKALSAVAAARDQDSKPVSIHFSGQGQRRVRIGYVVEAPVWKASYRLTLTDAKNEAAPDQSPSAKPPVVTPPAGVGAASEIGSPLQRRAPGLVGAFAGAVAADAGAAAGADLQGWAIVENQTDSDWDNIQLSLVSGRPISFIEDLYQPLFVSRPVVEPELFASLRPQRYAEGMGRAENGAAAARTPMIEEAQKQDAAGLGLGGGGAYGANRARALKRSSLQAGLQQQNQVESLADAALDPNASVSALASGASIGEFFQYTVGNVSLPRQKSAMIPIITDKVQTARLSIYNAAVLADHPLLGARLTNTTGKLLPQGPITVFDAGAYAGDATIEDLPTNQNRLFSYGIDQAVLVHGDDQKNESSLVTGRIVKGVLELTYMMTFTQKYLAQNKGKSDRTLLIEHARHGGWKLVEPKNPVETTDALYRFERPLAGDSSSALTVQEELVNGQGFQILPMDVGQIESYLRTGPIPDDVKKALQGVAKFKYALADTDRQIAERQQTINDITTEQNRIRENMKTVSASGDYYKRLEKELDAQETQLEKLKEDLKKLRQQRDAQQKELEGSLANLSVG